MRGRVRHVVAVAHDEGAGDISGVDVAGGGFRRHGRPFLVGLVADYQAVQWITRLCQAELYAEAWLAVL